MVLCTPSSTFKVTKVESSNTSVLCVGRAAEGEAVVAKKTGRQPAKEYLTPAEDEL